MPVPRQKTEEPWAANKPILLIPSHAKVSTGSFLQIFYTTEGTSLKAVKVYYLPNYKFN